MTLLRPINDKDFETITPLGSAITNDQIFDLNFVELVDYNANVSYGVQFLSNNQHLGYFEVVDEFLLPIDVDDFVEYTVNLQEIKIANQEHDLLGAISYDVQRGAKFLGEYVWQYYHQIKRRALQDKSFKHTLSPKLKALLEK